jgi:hypothetical protein
MCADERLSRIAPDIRRQAVAAILAQRIDAVVEDFIATYEPLMVPLRRKQFREDVNALKDLLKEQPKR